MQDLQGHAGTGVVMETLGAWQPPQGPAPIGQDSGVSLHIKGSSHGLLETSTDLMMGAIGGRFWIQTEMNSRKTNPQ